MGNTQETEHKAEIKMKVVLISMLAFLLLIAVVQAGPSRCRRCSTRKSRYCQRYKNGNFIVKCNQLQRYSRRVTCNNYQQNFCGSFNISFANIKHPQGVEQ